MRVLLCGKHGGNVIRWGRYGGRYSVEPPSDYDSEGNIVSRKPKNEQTEGERKKGILHRTMRVEQIVTILLTIAVIVAVVVIALQKVM